jgi:hypothetical protein
MESKQNQTSSRNGRKGYWSAVDTVILLLVLASIGGIIYRVAMSISREESEVSDTVYEVYFQVEETHRNVLDEVKGFDPVYLYENDRLLGAMGATIDPETGAYMAVLTPAYIEGTELATATGCMVCKGSAVQNGGLLVEGTGRYLTRGGVLKIRTDRVLLTVKITEIIERS